MQSNVLHRRPAGIGYSCERDGCLKPAFTEITFVDEDNDPYYEYVCAQHDDADPYGTEWEAQSGQYMPWKH